MDRWSNLIFHSVPFFIHTFVQSIDKFSSVCHRFSVKNVFVRCTKQFILTLSRIENSLAHLLLSYASIFSVTSAKITFGTTRKRFSARNSNSRHGNIWVEFIISKEIGWHFVDSTLIEIHTSFFFVRKKKSFRFSRFFFPFNHLYWRRRETKTASTYAMQSIR